jgi:glycosyltransferase involved in cell wall biosynthesis
MRTLVSQVADRRYELVIQLHRRFTDAGLIIARRMHIPFILRVEAVEVREADSWGLRRPGWGGLVERAGEFRLMKRSDLVASVSAEVDRDVARSGLVSERRLVVPNGVDLDAFSPGAPDLILRRSHDLEGRFVIGWVGGFQPFHGLDLIPRIASELSQRVPNAVLCLIGTGPVRDKLARMTTGLRDTVRLLPPVPHDSIPSWIRTFDACVLLAGDKRFHYSPLKLFEYQACGRPVIAPRVGMIPSLIDDSKDGLLVPPADPVAVADAVRRLELEPGLATSLGTSARARVARTASWGSRADTLLNVLAARGLRPRPEAGSDARYRT